MSHLAGKTLGLPLCEYSQVLQNQYMYNNIIVMWRVMLLSVCGTIIIPVCVCVVQTLYCQYSCRGMFVRVYSFNNV